MVRLICHDEREATAAQRTVLSQQEGAWRIGSYLEPTPGDGHDRIKQTELFSEHTQIHDPASCRSREELGCETNHLQDHAGADFHIFPAVRQIHAGAVPDRVDMLLLILQHFPTRVLVASTGPA